MRPTHALAFALALTLLAGCVEDVQPAAVIPVDLPSAPVTSVRSVIDPEGGHGEPSFGATPDGTLFANGEGGRGGGVYRSSDAGATWTRVATPVEPMPNFDPDLAVDVDGNVWFSALWIGCSAVAVSRDAGETWTSNPAVCNAPVGDRQYVIPTEGGTAYIYTHQLPTFQQMAMKTTDYGATWLPTGPAEGLAPHFLLANGGSGWGGGGFYNAATGSVFLTFTWSHGGLGALTDTGTWSAGYAVTRDGLTWEVGTIPSQGGRQLGLGLVTGAADEAGNVYIAWGEADDEDVGIWMAASTDDGMTFGAPFRVDGLAPGSKVFPAVAAGAPGKVAVAYYHADTPGFPDDVGDDALWNVTLAHTADATAASPVFEQANLTPAPVKKGAICISGTTCEGGREFLDYFQLHRLPGGRVGAVYNSLLDVEDKLVAVYTATTEAILG